MTESTPASISVETLPVLHYQNQRVVTTELLAQLYGTDVKNIQMNFANNDSRFEPGKHFHKLTGAELREFKHQPNPIGLVARNASHLLLWTERGAARHAKLLDTDQAWAVFERLEEAYFRAAPPAVALPAPAPAKPSAAEIDRQALAAAMAFYPLARERLLAGAPAPTPDNLSGLPADQIRVIQHHLNQAMALFHPLSTPFSNLLSLARALRGRDPQLTQRISGWVEVLPTVLAK